MGRKECTIQFVRDLYDRIHYTPHINHGSLHMSNIDRPTAYFRNLISAVLLSDSHRRNEPNVS